MGSPWTTRLSTHGLWAGLAGVSYKEPLANLTVHETQKPPWSTGPPQGQSEWRASQIVGYIWVCVCRGRRTVTSPAQHLFSCQRDLHPLPELWSITMYGTMWNWATTGWQKTPSVVSQAWHWRRLPNPVVTGMRPQRFSGDSWRSRIDERGMCFSVFLSACNFAYRI